MLYKSTSFVIKCLSGSTDLFADAAWITMISTRNIHIYLKVLPFHETKSQDTNMKVHRSWVGISDNYGNYVKHIVYLLTEELSRSSIQFMLNIPVIR